MTWVSLVSFLVLSSLALSNAGGYGTRFLHNPRLAFSYSAAAPRPIMADQLLVAPAVQPPVAISQPQISTGFIGQTSFVRPVAPTLPLSEADILCKGQRAETVIPLGAGERYVVCIDDSKGYEQVCPKSLLYNQQTRRCERKFGSPDFCASQPCLNGGQCFAAEYTFECRCPQGYAGKTCELDARVCQTQQPCGASADSFCQSFHVGAALQHVCILQGGLAYGISAQQFHPNPCNGRDGPHPLAFTNKGFIMCDGESMSVHSCPGGTIWDDLNKACSWPELEGTYSSSYTQTVRPVVAPVPAPLPTVRAFEQTFVQKPIVAVNQYSAPQPIETTYSRPQPLPTPTRFIQSQPSSYGARLQTEQPAPVPILPAPTPILPAPVEIPRPTQPIFTAPVPSPVRYDKY